MCPSHILFELEPVDLGNTLPGGEVKSLCSYVFMHIEPCYVMFGGLICRTHIFIMTWLRSFIKPLILQKSDRSSRCY